uniref:Hybrid PKS-NRPS synthetase prlS n=1 Tax=Fungal sp. (strain NRRL 50135) TaxID=1547289 RepID=PRLS_FUNXX|nr:RecName: Full=Hybrid PKS-NRPS synthetase prlS; AltName: Full=Pyrrolocin biosynthesis protein S [fungal sp. NRRL 50135]AIP87510.1 pyrrolocin synthetase [fungal sp. NRRL 50135]
MSSTEPIAVIGSACRFPGSSDRPSKLWELLREPRDLLQKVSERRRWHPDAFYHSDPEHHGTTNVRSSYFLDEDPADFDNAFFNIQPSEAEAIDPQQRMLMETVYDSLCSAGQTIEGLRGSSTAVIVGTMCDDWSGVLYKDWETIPQYSATGMGRSIMSNRVSYFFDWHGPSMTLDTACSSSLVAVHLAIQALRTGESRVAVAAGANLLLGPGMYIAEANLHMLSPKGRSAMWDKDVDGYARGEGIASVILKPLSAAIEDGDHIECLIRATGVNQDGRTQGLTMPSATAQAALIRETYARAGLDIDKPEDRPQFFHAHGTGTPAGDPQEAEAISKAFYSQDASDSLYVGSIKTVIGHTEGTAGLASLLGTSLALQHGMVPPNMHFNELNPRIAPFYGNLQVPTTAKPWPKLLPGQPRRASVNSFVFVIYLDSWLTWPPNAGFGGTNAHAILEAYEPPSVSPSAGPLFSPLTISAATEKSLRALMSSYSEYLKANPKTSLRDFAYTLQERRSTLAFRAAIAASTSDEAAIKIDGLLDAEDARELSTKHFGIPSPRLLGVFTGQGAQWPRMGARLVEASPFVATRLDELDASLASLPESIRPEWTLKEQMLEDAATSRVAEAAVSQPLCTAVQILLVDLLSVAGVRFHAVVGHSSGEIGAAYAAGLLSASSAIRIAYLRGLYAKLANSPNGNIRGAMMAAGTSFEDASEFCQLEGFEGRIQVAAVNSASSITLSGDEDAIAEAVEIFKDEGKFARQLKVDTAYHSAHMLPCSKPYLKSLEAMTDVLGADASGEGKPAWYSSVHEGEIMKPAALNPQYWVSNMTNTVLFAPAVAAAVAQSGPFDMALELGPHPALKGPCLDTLAEALGDRIPYSGLLSRGQDDISEMSAALGSVWSNLGAGSVSFETFEKSISGDLKGRNLIADLPKYEFDHSRSFWTISRAVGAQLVAHDPPHPVLGRRCVDRETSREIQWRNILSPKEVPWLKGHRIQGGIVYPAAGFVAMAVEAMRALAGKSSINLIKIDNLFIGRAIAFNEETSTVETLFSVKVVSSSDESIQASFSCYSGAPHEPGTSMGLNAEGIVTVTLADHEADVILFVEPKDFNMTEIETDRFYDQFQRLEYEYSPPFRGMLAIKRKKGHARGTIEDQSGSDWEDQFLIHPGMLDTAFQSSSAAFSCPGDGMMWGLYIPAGIQSIVINPYFTPAGMGKQQTLPWEAIARSMHKARSTMDINIFSQDSTHTFIQVEGLELMPFTAARPEDDAVIFSRFDYKIDGPSGDIAVADDGFTAEALENAIKGERVSFYYLRRLVESITPEEKANAPRYYRHLLDWASHVVDRVKSGKNPFVQSSWQLDTEEQIKAIWDKYGDRVDVRLIESVGKHLPDVIRKGTSILEHMEGLFEFYDQGLGLDMANRHLARMVAQVGHRYPQMRVFEIGEPRKPAPMLLCCHSDSRVLGAGTGGSTRTILSYLGDMFSSYTYTDISSGFFEAAQDRFKDFESRMVYKTFDMERDPESQGFVEGSYDLVLASNCLHATDKLEEMMTNARRLLRPGGYLIALELTSNETMRVGLPMGSLPGWWVGAESGRPWGPTVTLPQWDSLLRKCGFGGIDTSTPLLHKLHVSTVFAAQAVDDRVSLLRSPLASITVLPPTDAPRLVVVGGEALATHRIAERVASLLGPRFSDIARVTSFESLDIDALPYGSTVLSLSELDEPLFKNMNPAKLDALKTLWRQAGKILWVTRGARAEEPFSSMMLGLGRAMTHEYPNISLQILDLDRLEDEEKTAQLFTAELLRLEVLKKWQHEAQGEVDFLWSIEPEVCFEGGARLIPRLYKCRPANDRYNSARRPVMTEIDPRETPILFASEGASYELQHPSPLRIPSAPPAVSKTRTVNVSHFLLQTVHMSSAGRFMLFAGADRYTGERLLGLSHTTESQPTVPTEWTFPIASEGTNPAEALSSVYGQIIAREILKMVPKGSSIVVHEPDPSLGAALLQQAEACATEVVLTTSRKGSVSSEGRFIPANLSRRLVKKALPDSTSLYVDLSHAGESSEAGKLIGKCLPGSCSTYGSGYFHGTTPELRPGSSSSQLSAIFKAACEAAFEGQCQTAIPDIVQLQDVPSLRAIGRPLTVVDCVSTATVPVNVQTVDSGMIFRADKTYFLVGMSGQVGQSLCQWMVERGARYVVLTSRHPQVHPEYVKSMEAMGATIRVLPLDITSRDSLQQCYAEMCKTMPPVAGVAQGAMVLRDSMFDGLSFENLTAVLDPKVTGTQLLDELFYDAPLDFFIVMSSLTSVVGNSGQSNYTAANMFMVALAEQRRKRGVAGSAIAISSLIGIGYVERSEDFTGDYFEKIGYRNISEQDLHQLFAEAILVGRPGCRESSEITTGLEPFYPERNAKAQFFDDIRFNHFILERHDAQNLGGKGSAVPVRVQLAEVKTRDEAAVIIKGEANSRKNDFETQKADSRTDGFLARLRRTLMISQDEAVNEKASLVEQGIDSLMAVEVRSWFLKELEVDIPVLKILGGSSITDLLNEALERVPVSVVDLKAMANTKASTPEHRKVSVPPPPSVEVKSSSPGSSSEPQSSPADSPSRPSTPLRTPMTEMEESKTLAPVVVEKPKVYPAAKEEASEMSYGQARFWFLSGYLEDKTSFNMTVMFKLTGKLQVARLESAVRTVAQRHEALRTRFFWSGEGDRRTPMQGVLSESPIQLEHVRIESEADAQKQLAKMHEYVWDLNSWEAARMVLLTVDDDVHYFMVSGHHISWDGYSFTVLFVDLDAAYCGRPLAPLGPECQYPAFAAWQRDTYAAGAMKKAIDTYYRPMIDPHAKAIPLFPFAKSPTRPLLDHFEQFEAKATLQPALVSKLKQLSRKNGATMFHLYLAALQALVFRLLPEEDDFYLGVADANRMDKSFMGSLGFFLNLLPVRFDRSQPGTKISEIIKDTRNKAYKALENSFVPWNVLLQELKIPRTNTEAPIFQLFVDYRQIARDRAQWCGCALSDEDWLNARNGYDLTLGITDNPTGESLLSLRFQKKLYSEHSTNLFLRSYVTVLESFATGVDLEVSELPRWAPSDVEATLEAGKVYRKLMTNPQGPCTQLDWPATVSHRIDEMIHEHTAQPALKDGLGNSLTYGQMRDRINMISAALIAGGAIEGSSIGVFQNPSADWICSMLAIFRIGATYVPLDLRNSIARIVSIVADVQPTVILSDRYTTTKIRQIGAVQATEIVVSDIATSVSAPDLPNKAAPDSRAVILFTSGTTGKPKGVILTHANLRAQCEGYSRMVDLPSMVSVVLQQTIYNFDVSLDQIFAALADGGCLYVVPAEKRGDPQAITEIMAEQGVTYTVATPSEYEIWFRYARDNLARCKSWGYAFGGGEHLHSGLIHEFSSLAAQHIPGLRLFNNYGPTEASLAITKGEVQHSDPGLEDHVPAGWIIPNYKVAVVDEKLQPVPFETSGEILAGGPGVASGYLGQDELTREKFIAGVRIHPLAAKSANTWYRTGDRGRLRRDGALYVDGRILGDSQVKIRGFRVELQEIEAVLLEAAKGALSHAVITARGTGEDRFLAAHVVFAPDFPQHRRQATIHHLESKLPLPPYMQPTVIVPLASIPVTSNFKLDRKAIQALPLPETDGLGENLADVEKSVAMLWKSIIPHGVRDLTPETNFFDVGGNSILLVKLKAAMSRELKVTPLLIDLMNSSTLGGMARIVRASSGARVINWEAETSVPESLRALVKQKKTLSRSKRKNENLVVVLAGATGYLGRHILARLVNAPEVSEINCLVRDEGLEAATSSLQNSPKVRLIPADLSQPDIGLSLAKFSDLSQRADIVVDCAANRSFWDGYETLRTVNLDAVKELARLCVTNGASLHFVSSGAVQAYENSAPPTDGSDGYVASKWAAETFLRRAAESLGLQVHIHRPLGSADVGAPDSTPDRKNPSTKDEIQRDLDHILLKLGKRPDFSAVTGYVDVTPVNSVVSDMVAAMIQEISSGHGGAMLRVTEHRGRLRLHIKEFGDHIGASSQLSALPTMNPLFWFADAKKAGFAQLITSQRLVMHNKEGELVTRR